MIESGELGGITILVSNFSSRMDLSSTQPVDCITCRVIGSSALGITGLYALNQSRAHMPGSLGGKRAMACVGAGVTCLYIIFSETLNKTYHSGLLIAAWMRLFSKPKQDPPIEAIQANAQARR